MAESDLYRRPSPRAIRAWSPTVDAIEPHFAHARTRWHRFRCPRLSRLRRPRLTATVGTLATSWMVQRNR